MAKKGLLIIFLISVALPQLLISQSISVGTGHSIFLCSSNVPMACGYNVQGGLGDGTTTEQHNPVSITSLTDIVAVSAGGQHSLFLKSDGTVWSCGYNNYGQLGDGTNIDKHTPIQILTLGSDNKAISAGDYYSLFLKNDGTVWAVGLNDFGILGVGGATTTFSTVPILIPSLSGIVAIAAGQDHSLYLANDGTVWASGLNTPGQLGDGTNTSTLNNPPIHISTISNVISIAAGKSHSLFLKNDGTVWSCGFNNEGALGDGTYINKNTPIQVLNVSSIITISAGGESSLFLKNDGTVQACGNNGYGKLGDGTTTKHNIVVSVIGLCGFVGINKLSKSDIVIFPNPNNGDFKIKITDLLLTEFQIILTDVFGKVIINENHITSKQDLIYDIQSLTNGIYILQITGRNISYSYRVIKQ